MTGSVQDLKIVVMLAVIAKRGHWFEKDQKLKLERRSETGQVSSVCIDIDVDV